MTKRLGFAGLAIFYALLVALANRRHLWFDELYTFYIAQSPSLPDLWRNIQLDLNPPLVYLAARAAMRVFGNTAFAVRLPSILAFFAGSLCLYVVVSRRIRPSYGFLAVMILWSTPALYFATEARPYALILGFFGLAMLSWQRAIESPRPKWCVMTLALGVTGMMLSHFFAILFLTPFLLAESVRFIRVRRLDWPVAIALVAPCIVPFFFLHMPNGSAFPPAFQAGLRKMASFYYWTLYEEGWVLLLALCIALAIWIRPAQAGPRIRYTAIEISFVAGLLFIPIVVNATMMPTHGAFFTRYAVPALFAYPLALAALLAASTNANRLSAFAMCALLALYIPIQKLAKPLPKPPDFSQIHPDLPLIAASGLTFLEMDHEQPQRLYYLTGREYALKYAHATLFEGLTAAKQHFPIRGRVEPVDDFLHDHAKFLVLGTPDYPEDWLLRYLQATHAKLEFLGDFPSEYKDSQLFLVEITAN